MPDAARTIARPFVPGYPADADGAAPPSRAVVIANRVLALGDDELARDLFDVSRLLDTHRDVAETPCCAALTRWRRCSACPKRSTNAAAC